MAYEKELTAAEVKAKAKECGADIVGIAPMSRWGPEWGQPPFAGGIS